MSKSSSKASLFGDYFPEDVHDFGVDRHGFQIFLSGEKKTIYSDDDVVSEPGIDYMTASRFIINITMLSDIDCERPILIHMKTCGGIWEEGMAIYDAITMCPNPVTILAYAHARSMSSIILQAADRRVLMPNCYIMFHMGSLAIDGTHKQTVNTVKWTDEVTTKIMLDIYVERLAEGRKFKKKKNKAQIRKELKDTMDKKEDVYLTPRQAVNWGFADTVFNGNWITLCTKETR